MTSFRLCVSHLYPIKFICLTSKYVLLLIQVRAPSEHLVGCDNDGSLYHHEASMLWYSRNVCIHSWYKLMTNSWLKSLLEAWSSSAFGLVDDCWPNNISASRCGHYLLPQCRHSFFGFLALEQFFVQWLFLLRTSDEQLKQRVVHRIHSERRRLNKYLLNLSLAAWVKLIEFTLLVLFFELIAFGLISFEMIYVSVSLNEIGFEFR